MQRKKRLYFVLLVYAVERKNLPGWNIFELRVHNHIESVAQNTPFFDKCKLTIDQLTYI